MATAARGILGFDMLPVAKRRTAHVLPVQEERKKDRIEHSMARATAAATSAPSSSGSSPTAPASSALETTNARSSYGEASRKFARSKKIVSTRCRSDSGGADARTRRGAVASAPSWACDESGYWCDEPVTRMLLYRVCLDR